MTFAQRMASAAEHESSVASALTRAGYAVCPFGQGQLSEPVRDILRTWRTSLRWMPDILAVRRDAPPFLVDAKFGRTDTDCWDIEVASHSAHVRIQDALDVAVGLVWTDMTWCWTDDLANAIDTGRVCRGAFHGVGSGTPFYLVPKGMCRPWPELLEPAS